MGLPLERVELGAALDLSRRRRETEPLNKTSTELPAAEWGLTEFGRTEARRLTLRAFSRVASSAIAVPAGVLGLIVTLGFDVSLTELGWEDWLLLGAEAVLVAELGLLILAYERRRKSADKWVRYRAARPRGNSFYSECAPMRKPCAFAVAIIGVLILVRPPDAVFLLIVLLVSAGVARLHWRLGGFYLRACTKWQRDRGAPGGEPETPAPDEEQQRS
jgi:hypothetical protein